MMEDGSSVRIRDYRAKIMDPERAATFIKKIKSEGKKVGLTNGCFDILHAGHVDYLHQARMRCDFLAVGINSDESVKGLKGPTRPIVPENERAYVVSALESVDMVVIFGEKTADDLIMLLKPDVYIKGGDYLADTLPEFNTLSSLGIEPIFIPISSPQSTSGIIEKIKSL